MLETSATLSILFGLLSALSWGTGDFFGGLATRRTGVYGVVLVAELVGALLLAVLALLFGEAIPGMQSLMWGALAGLAGAFGLLMLYRGLAAGQMGIVAPISAVVSGVVPIVATMLMEGLPATVQMVGFALALVAVWLLSSHEGARLRLGDLWLPLAAGLGFGLYFVLITRSGSEAVFWPLVVARLAGALLIVIAAAVERAPLWPPRQVMPMAIPSGVFDAGGNLFFVLAAANGRLDVAAVLASLYSGITVLLAWLLLKERLTRPQWLGVATALAAITLIAL